MENIKQLMDQLMVLISQKEIMIGIIIFVGLILVMILNRHFKKRNYKTKLADIIVRYNSVKSVPLSFKLNKSVAIARLDEKAMQVVTHMKDDYDLCQSNLKEISVLLADCEDLLSLGKNKLVKNALIDLDALVELAETQVSALDEAFNSVLEKESAQRTEITRLKDEFRTLKNSLQERSAQLAFCWDMIEVKISQCERKFTTFEEWVYASEFDKANEELGYVQESITEFYMILDDLPKILQEVRGVIPSLIDECSGYFARESKRGVYLHHLEVYRNLELIEDTIKEDITNLKNGKLEGISSHCEDYKVRLSQLENQITREKNAFDEMVSYSNRVEEIIDECEGIQNFVESFNKESTVRFGFDKLDSVTLKSKLADLVLLKTKIFEMIANKTVPASTILISLKELAQDLEGLSVEFDAMKEQINSIRSDEERAQKQLLKLQLILNEMKVKIRKHRLPSISASYEEDMNKAQDYVKSIEEILDEPHLNVGMLNTLLQEAIDFVYKLYNNVNNIVGMATMIENTIVFGNKYRSTYPDIDSELTRAELCYRNGEYTQALKIAIATIEKIFPQTYETMIKENAQSAT